ncbi:MAG: bifunctional DNA primase/polymerase [Candidatus Binatus sp.]
MNGTESAAHPPRGERRSSEKERGKHDRHLTCALWYAAHGFYVFPGHGILYVERDGKRAPICTCSDSACEHPGKHPATLHGLKDATIDRASITRWWKSHPEWNIAIACEPSGVVVIDVDLRAAGDSTWAELKTELNINDDTAQALSGSGGPHVYYRLPAGVRVPSRSNALGPGVDVKSAGGYVIAPPSRHFTGGEYVWEVGHQITETPIAELPAPLVERLRDKTNEDRPHTTGGEGNDKPTGFDLLRALSGVPEGARNDQIFRAACSFRATNTARKVAIQACLEAAGKCVPSFPSDAAKKIVIRAYKTYKNDGRPRIEIVAGRRPWMIDLAEKIILDHRRWGLFQRSGIVVRVVEIDPSDDRKSIRRPNGAVMLKPMDSIALEDTFSRAINWHRRNRRGDFVSEDCPPKVAASYLARAGHWKLPVLTGVIEAPTIMPDGRMIESPGYDLASGLFLYSRENWLPVPEQATHADAESALALLTAPIAEFPFVSAADRSVIVSGILTGLVRRQLAAAPIIGLDAPTPGSGKSLLADCIAIILTGRVVASMPLGGNSEELRKRLTSILLAGDLVANIDNITRAMRSDALAMIVTQPVFADRLLGKNERPQLPTNLLWLCTANNLVFAGDLASRAIVCRIDPRCEKPEERNFVIADLRAHVRRERPRLVQAALTILKAYSRAGMPDQGLRPYGRFEEWSDWVRSALVWASGADPVATRERISLLDPDRQSTTAVLRAWADLFADRMLLLREVVGCAESATEGTAESNLRQSLLDVAAARNNPQKIDNRRLAGWCRNHADRIVGNLRLMRGDFESHKTGTWRIVKVDGAAARPETAEGVEV